MYHPVFGQMRLAAVVSAKSRAEAITTAAQRLGLSGYPASLFGLVAVAKMHQPQTGRAGT